MADEELEALGAEGTDDNDSVERTPEEYMAEIRALRKEAGNRRVLNKKQQEELEEFKKWKDSQKTELERAVEAKTLAEADLAVLRREKLQRDAAKEAGLDLDFADRIIGNTKEEMLADAERLAERLGKSKASANDLFAGRRGPAPKVNDSQDWLRSLIENT